MPTRTHKRVFHTELDRETWHFRRLVEHAQDQRYIYLPRVWHIVLGSLLAIFVALIFVPAFFLYKQAFFSLVAMLFPQVLVLGLMWAQSMTRGSVDEEIDGVYYWMAHDSLDVPLAIIGFVALLAAGGAFGFTLNGYLSCGQFDTNQQLGTFIFGPDATCPAAITDWDELPRRRNFATDLLWYQTCLDDQVATIAFMVVGAALIVLDGFIIGHEWMMRRRTLQMVLELAIMEQEAIEMVEMRQQGRAGAKKDDSSVMMALIEEESRDGGLLIHPTPGNPLFEHLLRGNAGKMFGKGAGGAGTSSAAVK